MAEILMAYLREQAALPFAYGTADCATLGIGWVDMLRGTDHAKGWASNYRTARGCKRFIAKGGGIERCIDAFLAERHGIGRASAPAAGNIICADVGGIVATGIRVNERMIAFRGQARLMLTTGANVLAEWAV